MRISDWSSDVCSSDLLYKTFIAFIALRLRRGEHGVRERRVGGEPEADEKRQRLIGHFDMIIELVELARHLVQAAAEGCLDPLRVIRCQNRLEGGFEAQPLRHPPRSEEHTSELQSLIRTSYAVFA